MSKVLVHKGLKNGKSERVSSWFVTIHSFYYYYLTEFEF